MIKHPLAGKPAPKEILIAPAKLIEAYYKAIPDLGVPEQKVTFGTSGHRGSSLNASFTEAHILAITQAICEFRRSRGIDGPLFMGKDTHALSFPAEQSALEVLAAHGVEVRIQAENGFTPTPVISHAILTFNKNRKDHLADGIVITPSHNPPEDGGFKYNPPRGGPADTATTQWIQNRANEILKSKNTEVKRLSIENAKRLPSTQVIDFVTPYVKDLNAVINLDLIKNADLKLGVDPLGGASVAYWPRIAEMWGLKITIVNSKVDPTFSFMTVDHDGKIRMDCSSADAMASLISLHTKYDIAFGNDPDADRHGIVTRSSGLMDPNHYLAACISYLYPHRPQWSKDAKVGKTLVSSGIIDRVARKIGRAIYEVPVGFKWFVDGLYDGSLGFGGEESAGASFLRKDGTVWSTDKDGIILNLLAAEMTAVTKKDPSQLFEDLSAELGKSFYKRVDAPASLEQKTAFKKLTPDKVTSTSLGSESIVSKMTNAPGNNEPIGGLKVTTENGWFAARPSGTENIYKIYAESFVSEAHLDSIISEAKTIVDSALGS